MAPLVLSVQRTATFKRNLRSRVFEKRRGNGGYSDMVQERDTTSEHILSSPDAASEKLSGYSKPKPAPMSAAKTVSKPMKIARTTHKIGPQSTPKTAPHPKSSFHVAPQRPSRTSTHKIPSNTPISEFPKPIPTSLSLPHPSSTSPPFQGQPRSEHSPSQSAPPPQTHSISSHTRTIAAVVGSVSAVCLLVALCLLLRYYRHRGRRNKHSKRTLIQRRKDEEAHPKKKSNGVRESTTGVFIEMVRPTQTPRRDFGSQFSPSLESQAQRNSPYQEAYENDEGETLRIGQVPRRHPVVLERAISYFSLPSPVVEAADEREISYFSLPSPVVGVAERAAAYSGGEARIVYLAEEEEEDGGDVGRVVSLGDRCVIEMLVRVMDDEERRGEVGIVAQERREIDDVVVTVANLGTRVVEAEDDGAERGAEGEGSMHGGLGIRVEDGHLHGRELDSEDEDDDCSFKSTRGSIGLDDPEDGKSSEEEREGAGRDVRAAGGVEVADSEGIRVMMGLSPSK